MRRQAGFANVIVTIPFRRTAADASRVLQVKAENGLQRGEAGLEVCGMREIPSKVTPAGAFAKRSKGFSICLHALMQPTPEADQDCGMLSNLSGIIRVENRIADAGSEPEASRGTG